MRKQRYGTSLPSDRQRNFHVGFFLDGDLVESFMLEPRAPKWGFCKWFCSSGTREVPTVRVYGFCFTARLMFNLKQIMPAYVAVKLVSSLRAEGCSVRAWLTHLSCTAGLYGLSSLTGSSTSVWEISILQASSLLVVWSHPPEALLHVGVHKLPQGFLKE